jgi:WD40 repeat protein
VSSSTNVYGYDLRHHMNTFSYSPIVKTPHLDLSSSFQCIDEINQLSFSFPKHNKDCSSKYYQLAAVDDCGEVHIPLECIPQSISQKSRIQLTTKHTVLHHAEPGSHTIASSAVFRPRVNNGSYLASGGTDCMVKLFDVTKPKRACSTIHIKPTESLNATQICNPPFIHSLQWSPSGRLLAAGVGDGSCVILRGEGNRLVEVGRLGYDQGGHGSAVAAVCFPGFGSSSTRSSSVEAEDRLLISAGNDGKIVFWDLGGNLVAGNALDPLLYLGKNDNDVEERAVDAMNSVTVSSKNSKSKNKKQGKTNNQDEVAVDDAEFLDLLSSPSKVLFQILHNNKPNWITCSRASDAALPSSLFVCDTTNDVSIYTLSS